MMCSYMLELEPSLAQYVKSLALIKWAGPTLFFVYTEVPIVKSDLLLVVTQLAAERNLPQSTVISVVKAALSSAYRRDPAAGGQDVEVDVDLDKGEVTLHTVMRVVAEVEDPAMELTIEQAADIGHKVKSGDYIITGSLEHVPGRIAAQTAKQVVLQKLREAERDIVFDEFSDREGEILTATVQRKLRCLYRNNPNMSAIDLDNSLSFIYFKSEGVFVGLRLWFRELIRIY